jgi:large subunit ribosomal protein L27e
MPKFWKPGKVVVLLNGRYAGRKAVIVKHYDEGTKDRSYGHCLVAGIDRYPRAVTTHMTKKKIMRRSKVKPFVRVVNFNHIMPTRYSIDADLKNVNHETDPTKREAARKIVRKAFEDRYKSGKNKWFFTKLRF